MSAETRAGSRDQLRPLSSAVGSQITNNSTDSPSLISVKRKCFTNNVESIKIILASCLKHGLTKLLGVKLAL